MLKISDFYLNKQKSFIPQKNISWIALFSANRWHLDVSTFLIKGFGYNCNKNDGLIFLSKANPKAAKALADRIWDFLRRIKT